MGLLDGMGLSNRQAAQGDGSTGTTFWVHYHCQSDFDIGGMPQPAYFRSASNTCYSKGDNNNGNNGNDNSYILVNLHSMS